MIWDPQTWAEHEFGDCELGDRRRNKRLKKLAVQMAARPDGSTPDQLETWADLKAAYRLFDSDDVSFQAIVAPHHRRTREDGQAGDVKLILNDTTELDFTAHRNTDGLGPIGNGGGRGFFVHSGLMIDALTKQTDGMAGQEIFYRPPTGTKKGAKNSRRRDPNRESAVWGRLMDRIGAPPPDVRWIHVCDRGADDYEVFLRAQFHRCGFVIRAARLNRKVHTLDGRGLTLAQFLDELPSHGERPIAVKATTQQPGRTARVALRFGELFLPLPTVLTPWLKEHRPSAALRLRVVELRELSPPAGATPVRWVLYTTEAADTLDAANRVIEYYEQRPMIEDFHKCWKTGCHVEERQYATAARLERVAGLLSVVAVRLLQLRTAARETPARPAAEVAPHAWIEMLRTVRKIPATRPLTIRDFVRQLAGLGGHLLRKGDGEPGWITLWRGYEKLQLLLRGAQASRKRCG
ncbi:MAG: IS4 family transposase [Nitrospirota bacterium]